MVPLVRPILVSLLKIDAERAARSEEKIRALVDEVSARLAGQRYLVGDRFSAADIAFASMLAPAICVSPEEGYSATFPTLDECPPAYRDLALHVRASAAGAFALRMFREERGRGARGQSLPR
jgi:glutathione S-transferase